jgi:hypothetical protein
MFVYPALLGSRYSGRVILPEVTFTVCCDEKIKDKTYLQNIAVNRKHCIYGLPRVLGDDTSL